MFDIFLDSWQKEKLMEVTVDELQGYLDSGEITSKQVLLMYLNRIAEFDKKGPELNTVIELNPNALQIAAALDVEREYKGSRSKLHGIPVLIKDNMETEDRMHTSAGSLALENHRAKTDAHLVAALKRAGAIVLGKANLTEWANFMADKMPSGFSSRGGQVLNPYGPGEFDCGGSSSGSGAAIAANFAPLALGTETSGSILSPSSDNSVVGIKPTVGLISRSGIIPISHSQDTAGPIARTVADAALMLNYITEPDVNDPVTQTHNNIPDDYTKYLNKDRLQNARIGWSEKIIKHLEDDKQELMERAIKELEKCGAKIISLEDFPPTSDWDLNVLHYEFKAGVDAYLANTSKEVPVKNLADVIHYNYKHKQVALKYGQERLLRAEETSGTLTEPEYLLSREYDIYYSTTAGIDAVMDKHKLDALLSPANLGANIPARAGYPSITVPAGYTSGGKPMGVTFTAKAYQEPELIGLAYSYEQQTAHRKAPNL